VPEAVMFIRSSRYIRSGPPQFYGAEIISTHFVKVNFSA